MQYYVMYFCMFSVLILFSFHLHFILAITKDVNTKTYNIEIYCSKVNLTSPSRSHVRGKKSKVMCNASYMCMCALSHMCMLIHIQKCPVTLIMNPVPPVVCKEIDSYPSYSHSVMTRYTWMPMVVCVFTFGIRFSSSKILMWVLPAATEAKG